MNDGRQITRIDQKTQVKHSGCPETLKHFLTVKMAGCIRFLCLFRGYLDCMEISLLVFSLLISNEYTT